MDALPVSPPVTRLTAYGRLQVDALQIILNTSKGQWFRVCELVTRRASFYKLYVRQSDKKYIVTSWASGRNPI